MKRVALLVALAACAPKDINYQVSIVTQSCDGMSNPFDKVQYVQVRVSGDDLAALIAGGAASTKSLKVPQIPPGTHRVIEVRGYDNDPASGGQLISIGRSLPFDVPDVVPDDLAGKAIEKTVILRKIGIFAPIVSATSPTVCQRMSVPRAGHTATLLKSGKVFIAGGYNVKAGERNALADTEIFDPSTGTFQSARDISFTANGTSYKQERAFHTATLIPKSGQVVLWGGENYLPPGSIPNPRASFLFYDPDVDQYGALPPRNPLGIRRSHHAVALTSSEKLLIVGGVSSSTGTLINEIEWLDPETTAYKIIDGISLPVVGASVFPVKKGELIAVAGGSVSGVLSTEISFFKYTGSTFAKQTTSPRLSTARRSAAVANVHDGADLIVLGGYDDPNDVKPIASSEIITPAGATPTQGPNVGARGDICAASLRDGTVMATGGRTADSPSSPSRSDASSVLVKVGTSGGLTTQIGPDLPIARWAHTCTTLADGSVLVTGGINETTAGQEILQDAWIYTPAPAAD